MAQTYDQRQELLAKLQSDLRRALSPEEFARFDSLPAPCRNHLKDRLGKIERGRRLIAGCSRLALFDSDLFLEGLRLHPHAVCRSAEALGPVPEKLWETIGQELSEHRLWMAAGELQSPPDEEAFWRAVERLEVHRELPQPILDFQEEGRPRAEAPWHDFRLNLQRFLVRARLEKLRFQTYAVVKSQENV